MLYHHPVICSQGHTAMEFQAGKYKTQRENAKSLR